jgi:hypothetical protein
MGFRYVRAVRGTNGCAVATVAAPTRAAAKRAEYILENLMPSSCQIGQAVKNPSLPIISHP